MKITIDIEDNDIINILNKFIPLLNPKEQNNGCKFINPNKRHDPNHTIVGIFDSEEKVDRFFDRYSYNNNYAYNDFDCLKVGQRIQINDGTYNKLWYIAGFDCEHNKVASDGTIYDNGHGIMLIPETYLASSQWNTTSNTSSGYIGSTIHTTTLPTIANNLKTVLGNHLINRNVLLSSKFDDNTKKLISHKWTHAYCTLPSVSQLSDIFPWYNKEIYNDGEAVYRLPLFNFLYHSSIISNKFVWTRCIASKDTVYTLDGDSLEEMYTNNPNVQIYPLIYIG